MNMTIWKGTIPPPPLRAVLSRKFVAYEGTYITLACRHVLLRTRDTHRTKMRCVECAGYPPETDYSGIDDGV